VIKGGRKKKPDTKPRGSHFFIKIVRGGDEKNKRGGGVTI